MGHWWSSWVHPTSIVYQQNDIVEVQTNNKYNPNRIGVIRSITHNKYYKQWMYGIELIESIGGGCNGCYYGRHLFECPTSYGIFVGKHQIVQKLSISTDKGSQKLYKVCLNGLNHRNKDIEELERKYQHLENTRNEIGKTLSDCLNNNKYTVQTVEALSAICNKPTYIDTTQTEQYDNDDSSSSHDEDIDIEIKIEKPKSSIQHNEYYLNQYDEKERENIKLKDEINTLNESMKQLNSKNVEQTIMHTNDIFEKGNLKQKINKLEKIIEQMRNEQNEYKHAGIVGLKNVENTCWMNSIIQCLSHSPKIIECFVKLPIDGDVSNSFKEIINNICNNHGKLMKDSLHRFKAKMASISTRYDSYDEQDPAEFLDLLLNVLHNELNMASDDYANSDIIVGNGMPDNMVSILSWTAYLKSNNSPIIDLFYGQHKSSLICANNKCKYDYVIFEPFKILPVCTNLVNRKNTLYDCIDQYVSQNRLIDSNWYCNKCKQDLPNSIEQIQLYKFPKILIIQLKKLKMQNKNQQPFIKYPVNNLDLTKYNICDPNKEQIYDLFAVSCLSGHHCIAYARNHINNQWFYCNDSQIRQVDKKEVVVRNAYVLFYQRK